MVHKDKRYKYTMCGYGSCRVEWIKRDSRSSGPLKYCKPHSIIVHAANLKKAQAKYRAGLAPGVIACRNKQYCADYPDYFKEYYIKNKTR